MTLPKEHKPNRLFKVIGIILKVWAVLLFVLLVIAAILYDPIGGLVEIPATLLIYVGIPYGIFWIIRKKMTIKK